MTNRGEDLVVLVGEALVGGTPLRRWGPVRGFREAVCLLVHHHYFGVAIPPQTWTDCAACFAAEPAPEGPAAKALLLIAREPGLSPDRYWALVGLVARIHVDEPLRALALAALLATRGPQLPTQGPPMPLAARAGGAVAAYLASPPAVAPAPLRSKFFESPREPLLAWARDLLALWESALAAGAGEAVPTAPLPRWLPDEARHAFDAAGAAQCARQATAALEAGAIAQADTLILQGQALRRGGAPGFPSWTALAWRAAEADLSLATRSAVAAALGDEPPRHEPHFGAGRALLQAAETWREVLALAEEPILTAGSVEALADPGEAFPEVLWVPTQDPVQHARNAVRAALLVGPAWSGTAAEFLAAGPAAWQRGFEATLPPEAYFVRRITGAAAEGDNFGRRLATKAWVPPEALQAITRLRGPDEEKRTWLRVCQGFAREAFGRYITHTGTEINHMCETYGSLLEAGDPVLGEVPTKRMPFTTHFRGALAQWNAAHPAEPQFSPSANLGGAAVEHARKAVEVTKTLVAKAEAFAAVMADPADAPAAWTFLFTGHLTGYALTRLRHTAAWDQAGRPWVRQTARGWRRALDPHLPSPLQREGLPALMGDTADKITKAVGSLPPAQAAALAYATGASLLWFLLGDEEIPRDLFPARHRAFQPRDVDALQARTRALPAGIRAALRTPLAPLIIGSEGIDAALTTLTAHTTAALASPGLTEGARATLTTHLHKLEHLQRSPAALRLLATSPAYPQRRYLTALARAIPGLAPHPQISRWLPVAEAVLAAACAPTQLGAQPLAAAPGTTPAAELLALVPSLVRMPFTGVCRTRTVLPVISTSPRYVLRWAGARTATAAIYDLLEHGAPSAATAEGLVTAMGLDAAASPAATAHVRLGTPTYRATAGQATEQFTCRDPTPAISLLVTGPKLTGYWAPEAAQAAFLARAAKAGLAPGTAKALFKTLRPLRVGAWVVLNPAVVAIFQRALAEHPDAVQAARGDARTAYPVELGQLLVNPPRGPSRKPTAAISLAGVQSALRRSPSPQVPGWRRHTTVDVRGAEDNPRAVGLDLNQLGHSALVFGALDDVGGGHPVEATLVTRAPGGSTQEQPATAPLERVATLMATLEHQMASLQAKIQCTGGTPRQRGQLRLLHQRRAGLKTFADHYAAFLVYEVARQIKPDALGYEDLGGLSPRGRRGTLAKVVTWMVKRLPALMAQVTRWGVPTALTEVDAAGTSQRHHGCGGTLDFAADYHVGVCPRCGQRVDRHLNAAYNIAQRALSIGP